MAKHPYVVAAYHFFDQHTISIFFPSDTAGEYDFDIEGNHAQGYERYRVTREERDSNVKYFGPLHCDKPNGYEELQNTTTHVQPVADKGQLEKVLKEMLLKTSRNFDESPKYRDLLEHIDEL